MEPEEERLLRAFDEELEYSQHGRRVRLLTQTIDDLVCPTGEILAGDPLYVLSPQDIKPFKERIPPGKYPVDVAIA